MSSKIMLQLLVLWSAITGILCRNCAQPSPTTVSGTRAPQGELCSGDLIFSDNFNKFDLRVWNHESTLGGGGNWEFQWYTNNRSNSYAENGLLHLKPTLLSDEFGEQFLYSGTLDINGGVPTDQCTNAKWYGCSRTGSANSILNPIKSARIRTVNSFNFRYGKLEVSAKLPRGDWLWPAIWLLPRDNQYSTWPASGEIDVMESRGNKNLVGANGVDIGTAQIGSTLHWGPNPSKNLYQLTHFESNRPEGWDEAFHRYQMVWSEDEITFAVDDKVHGRVSVGQGGFWKLGNLTKSGYENPWRGGSKMAPFDQEFYIVLNVAVGGVNGYFPDGLGKKPWKDTSSRASYDFWKGREQWLPTWDYKNNGVEFLIDYVKVWAL